MAANTIFLLVEGPHDAEFMARLLNLRGFQQRKRLSDIEPRFHNMFPRVYPHTDSTLLTERHPVPAFYKSAGQWLVILVGGGSKSAVTLGAALRSARLAGFDPDAVGVILDQDLDATPEDARDRFTAEFTKVKDLPVPLDFTLTPGSVVSGAPRLGLYVLPDNQNTGTLEDLLLDCAEQNYSALKTKAMGYRDDALKDAGLNTDDLEQYGTTGGQKDVSKRKKAWVGAMGSILVPAAAIQNSIRLNRWLEGTALELGRVKALRKFLDDLIL
jgi:hypothetical protein